MLSSGSNFQSSYSRGHISTAVCTEQRKAESVGLTRLIVRIESILWFPARPPGQQAIELVRRRQETLTSFGELAGPGLLAHYIELPGDTEILELYQDLPLSNALGSLSPFPEPMRIAAPCENFASQRSPFLTPT